MPSVPNSTQNQTSPGREYALHNSSRATSVPAIGVHKPAMSRSASASTIPADTSASLEALPESAIIPWSAKAIAATRRMRRSAAPGQPRANVENNLRKKPDRQLLLAQRTTRWCFLSTLASKLKFRMVSNARGRPKRDSSFTL